MGVELDDRHQDTFNAWPCKHALSHLCMSPPKSCTLCFLSGSVDCADRGEDNLGNDFDIANLLTLAPSRMKQLVIVLA